MDRYTEQIVKKEPSTKEPLVMLGAVLTVCLGVVFVLFISLSYGVAIMAVGGYLIYFARISSYAEYEYIFINGDCDIAKITNKSFRKEIFSFNEGEIQRIIRYDSEAFQNELEVNRQLIVKHYNSNNDENRQAWYAFMLSAGNKTKAVVLELNEKTVEHVQECLKKKLG